MSHEVNDKLDRRGVSMLELVIAMMVMGIMTAVAAPRFAASLQHHQIEMAAKRVVTDLESVRSLAYTTGTSQTIRFADNLGTYQILGVVDPDRPTEANTIVNLTDTPYHCGVVSVNFVDLTYNGHGIPNSGGSIVIGSGELRRTITVNATSGRATYQ